MPILSQTPFSSCFPKAGKGLVVSCFVLMVFEGEEMNRSANKRLIRRKSVVAVTFIVAVIAFIALVGCNSSNSAVLVPSDHYVGGNTTAGIEFEHSRCEACHEGLVRGFDMSGNDLLEVHRVAWNTFVAGGELTDDARQLLNENQEVMKTYFGTQGNDLDCQRCHETTLERGGFGIGTMNSTEFCLECHDDAEVTAKTADWNGEKGVNPHSSHVEEEKELACDSCHVFHSHNSSLYCNECHAFEAAEGWISPPAFQES
jgi:hypothetical protein